MKSAILLLLCCLIAVATSQTVPPVWPYPKQFTSGTTTYSVNSVGFYLSSRSTPSDDVEAAFDRFLAVTFPRRAATNTGFNSVRVLLTTAATPTLQMGVDESYNLEISSSSIIINAANVFGAYHGLQTLSQMITFDFNTENYVILNSPWSITDAPRFPHRGMLIDTGRHYLSTPTIRQVIDSMTFAKFNVLHWHLADAQSFAYKAPSYPNLMKGAFSSSERYTQNDIADIVAYAKARGVRVMIEVDVPGHFGGFCAGAPEACLSPQCATSYVNDYPMNIANEGAYAMVQKVLNDLAAVAPETLFHLGGDQPAEDCWTSNSQVSTWLSSKGYSASGGYKYAFNRVAEMAATLGRHVVGWHEVWEYFGSSLNKNTIIEQRKTTPASAQAMNKDITSRGYRLLWGDSSRWYLDKLDVTWTTMYTAEPCAGLTTAECKNVIGGEACMWGETVDNSDILQTIWPRAAAIAERLWSPADKTTTTTAAANRIASFRCLLNMRGVAAAPLSGKGRNTPTGPGSCFTQ